MCLSLYSLSTFLLWFFIQLIKSSSENVGPATLILVNGSPTKISNREWDRVRKIIENTPLRVIVITYEDDNQSDGAKQLMELGRFGGVYKVIDQGTSGNHNLDQNEVLSNIFIQIISENLGTPLNKVETLTQTTIFFIAFFT